MSTKKLTNIQVYKRRPSLNIGVFIFGIVFIYMMIIIISSLTHKSISTYEVRTGTILKEASYTGVAIRTEEVFHANEGGYINYLVPEGSKVGVKTKTFSISKKALDFHEKGEVEQALSKEEEETIYHKILSFQEGYQPEDFDDVYSLKEQINTLLREKSNLSRQSQLEDMSTHTGDISTYTAEKDGIIQYSVDGYESLSLESVSKKQIEKTNYKIRHHKDNTKIKEGAPIYKLIRDDYWTVCISLDKEMANLLEKREYVRVRFTKDGYLMWAKIKVEKRKKEYIGILSFDTAMIKYAKDRFIHLNLILEDANGLKIPKSSVAQRTYYEIPRDYLTTGGNTSSYGVLLEGKKGKVHFVPLTQYHLKEEQGLAYIDKESFSKGDILRKPDSSDSFALKKEETFDGVYHVNRGYASFRQVHILSESEDYYIVEPSSSHGLSDYDFIALYGKDMKENQVIF